MKRIASIIIVVLLVTSALLVFGACNQKKDEIIMWSYDTFTTNAMLEEYAKVYPEDAAKIRVVPVDGNAYMSLLQTALFVEEEVPDIIWGDYFSRGKLFSLGVCEDLSKPEYNLDTSLISDWVLDLCKNEDGEILGIESGPAPTGLVYKRDICKQYLGTDNPEELSKKFETWESFVAACETIYEDSNHQVIPFASIGDVYCIIVGMENVPYMKDGKQNIDAVCDAVFPKLEEFVNKGLCGKMDQWTAAYYTSYNNDKYAFNICPAWCPDYHIKENAKDQVDNLGVCLSAGGKMYSFGGTTYSIYSKSTHKQEAWQFINWALLTEQGQRSVHDNVIAKGGTGGVGTLKTLYGDESMYGGSSELFGGQKVTKFFLDHMDQVNARPLTKYDTTFSESLGLVLNSMKNGKSAEDCKTQVMDEVKLKLPELFK